MRVKMANFKRFVSNNIVRKATVITGDGNSGRLVSSVVSALKSKLPLEFEIFDGSPDPEKFRNILESVRKNKIAIKGAWSTSIDDSHESYNVAFRRDLDLWANVVHIKSHAFLKSSKSDVDFVVIRQNTEGEYSQIEHETAPGYVEMFKITTAERSRQIAEFAFEYAWRNSRKKVTCIHKANIMKMGDGLFLNTCRAVSQQHTNIQFSNMIVDNAAMQLTMRPHQFDVMVLPNLYGNIMVAIGSGLVGSSALFAGSNYNTANGLAVFESAARSVVKDAVDNLQANPCGVVLAVCKMLKHIGEFELGFQIEHAMLRTIECARTSPPDIGGTSTTDDLMEAILKNINTILK